MKIEIEEEEGKLEEEIKIIIYDVPGGVDFDVILIYKKKKLIFYQNKNRKKGNKKSVKVMDI